MSTSKPNPVTVRILEQEYRIACDPGEEDSLIAAARFLHQQLSEMRATGKVIGAERLATMVALNLSHELLQLQHATSRSAKGLNQRLKSMRERLDRALNDSNQLEL